MKAESDFSPPARAAPPAPWQLCVPAGCCRALHQAPQVRAPAEQQCATSSYLRATLPNPSALLPAVASGVCSPHSPAELLQVPGWAPRLRFCLHSPAAWEQTPAAELRIPLPTVREAAGGALSPLNIHTRLRALTAPAPAGTAPCSLAIPALRCHQHICNT